MGRTSRFIEKNIVRPALKKELEGVKRTIDKSILSRGGNKKEKDLQLTSNAYGNAVFSDFYDTGSFNTSELLDRYFGWVYACIKAIADDVSSLDLKLMRVLPNGELEEVDEHEVLTLLRHVNGNMTFANLVALYVIHKKLTGEAYWYLYKKGTQIQQIQPVQPSYVIPQTGDYRTTGMIKGYEVNMPTLGRQFVEAADMIQFKEPHPTSMVRGFGVLEASIRAANMEVNAEDWNNAFFKNAASTGAVLIFNGKLGEDTKKRLVASLEAQYQGLKKAHKTFIIDQGGDYKEAGRTQREMEFVAMQAWVRDKILAMFRVSKAILGITEDVNRANAEASEFIYSKRVLKPEFGSLCDTLTEFLLPQYEGTEDLFFDFEDPVPQDKVALVEQIKALTPTVITVNEARAMLDQDPVGEEGDILYVSSLLGKLGAEQEQPSEPGVPGEPAEDPEDEPVESDVILQKIKVAPFKKKQTPYQRKQVSRIKNDPKFKHYSEIKLKAESAALLAVKALKEKNDPAGEDKMEVFWKTMSDDSKTYVNEIRGTLRKIFQNDVIQIKKKISVTKAVFEKAVTQERLTDVIEYLTESKYLKRLIEDEVTETLYRANKAQGRRAANSLTDRPYIFTGVIKQKLTNFVKKMSTSVQDTRSDRIIGVLKDGIQKGLSIDKLVKNIQDVYDDIEKFKARQIATTEVFRSFNYANIQAWEQSEIISAKQWFTAADERTCEFCGPMHGKVTELSNDFFEKGYELTGFAGGVLNLDYEDVGSPPLHPQCRCTVAPIIGSIHKELKVNKNIKSQKTLELEEPSREYVNELTLKRHKIKALQEQNEELESKLDMVLKNILEEEHGIE